MPREATTSSCWASLAATEEKVGAARSLQASPASPKQTERTAFQLLGFLGSEWGRRAGVAELVPRAGGKGGRGTRQLQSQVVHRAMLMPHQTAAD
jgi:hypothetical protein